MRGVSAWGLVALCLAAPMWGLGRVIALVAPVLLAVALTGMVSMLLPRPVDDGNEAPRAGWVVPVRLSEELRWWGLVAVGCASVVVCLAVTSVASVGLLLCVVLLVLTSPPLRALASKWGCPARVGRPERDDLRPAPLTGTSSDQAKAVDGEDLPGSGHPDARMADLSTTDLCHLWRVTYWMVKDLRSPVRTLRVVELREAVLDELERRRPDAVTRWLTAGHHEADGPARYL